MSAFGSSRRSLPAMAYYSSVFPEAAMRKWLGQMRLHTRPVCGVSVDGFWTTFSGLDTALAAAKKGDIVEMHVSLGPDPDGFFGCFFLDFDINECLPRACCKAEKKLCDVCLPIVAAWGVHLKAVISEVLNIPPEQVLCVLSGSKGMHLWAKLPFPVRRSVRDSYYDRFDRRIWTEELMYEIACFVSAIPLHYFRHALESYGTPEFQLALKRSSGNHEEFVKCVNSFRRKSFPREDMLDTVNFIYTTAFPLQYDKKVVTSESHNLRLPLSVNFISGGREAHRIVVGVNSASDFPLLNDIPTIESLDETTVECVVHALDCVLELDENVQ